MNLSTAEKVAALRELTRGAEDVFAAYTLSNMSDKDRWRPVYAPLDDQNIIAHLSGVMEIGSYPLIPAEKWPRVHWILADFDGKREGTNWQADVRRAVECLMDFDGCPCFVNLSRSGKGAHVRMLFREPVPAWLARRWMTSWLQEADVIKDPNDWEIVPPSFDRLIPPQDSLSGGVNSYGNRLPGNLAGSPLNGRHARSHGGTLPLDTFRVAQGNFEPDGKHWEHVMSALEHRGWGETELLAALADCPEKLSTNPPNFGWTGRGAASETFAVPPGTSRALEYMRKFCAFMKHMEEPGAQTYPLWLAMATELHRFGDEGLRAYHEISSLDPRYNPADTDRKWEQSQSMYPVRCDTLVHMGYCCPHLNSPRCNGPKAPTYFADRTDAEIL